MIRIGRAAIALTGSIFAAAVPMLMPNSVQAECLEWDLSQVPEWHLRQSNNYIVSFTFQQKGTELQGSGSYYLPPYPNQLMKGTLKGSLYGGSFQVHPSWGGVYYGSVNGDGTLTGNTVNDAQTETATWNAAETEKATCLKEKTASPSAPPPPASPLDEAGVLKKPGAGGDIFKKTTTSESPAGPGPGSKTATVIADVDVFKQAGGEEKDKIGILYSNNKTTKVTLVASCQDNWCHVKGDPVPTGEGWVYSGTPPDFQSLQF